MQITRRLDEVCSIVMGQAPPGESYNLEGVGWPLVAGPGDFQGDRPVVKKFTKDAARCSSTGDIILGVRASIGVKVWSDRVYALGRGVAGLTPDENIEPRYLWHWLTKSAPELLAKGKGAIFKQVTRHDIAEMEVPLPSMEEQRRIADVLDRVDALRVARRMWLQELDGLVESWFDHHMLNPARDARLVTLESVADLQGGLQVSGSRRGNPNDVPYLRVANVHRNALDLSDVKRLRVTETEARRTLLAAGDVLVVEGHGNRLEVGRAAMWEEAIDGCVHQNHLMRVRFDPDKVLPEFGLFVLNSQIGRRYFRRMSKTTSGLNTINMTSLKGMTVPVVSLDEQEAFRSILLLKREQEVRGRRALGELDALFASLQHRAFRGEL
ncbi:restriction endonuclease subunit S [Solwaraspora sp. WMMB335]|uniref:restriction endonuclease subunit S n=1 Tax=Solwaraspora sp. WMMB335 TaxID=3404118 RepID=UPI003B922271